MATTLEDFRIIGIDHWRLRDTDVVVSLALVPSLYKGRSSEVAEHPVRWQGRPTAGIGAPPETSLISIPARLRGGPPAAPLARRPAPSPAPVVDESPAEPVEPSAGEAFAPMVEASYDDDPWTIGRVRSKAEFSRAKFEGLSRAARDACGLNGTNSSTSFSRKMVFWALYKFTSMQRTQIARLAGRDNSTVSYAVRQMNHMIDFMRLQFDDATDMRDLFCVIYERRDK